MARKPSKTKAAEASAAFPAAANAVPGLDLAAHRKRSDRAWSERAHWQELYDDAYEFAIPYRKPAARTGKGEVRVDRLFDNTALTGVLKFAGKLQQDLFPPGQAFFTLAFGPVARTLLESQGTLEAQNRELQRITSIISAFFQTGEFDTAVVDMCTDLAAGTAALLVMKGDQDMPLRFFCIPFDEVAIEIGAYGHVVAIFWKTKMARRAVHEQFPKGQFTPEDLKALAEKPEEEVCLRQDFTQDAKTRRWHFVAYFENGRAPIATERYRAQPIAVPRYFRVPGEGYGRGPILMALPAIKTLNKAMEITLKAAAIQMLGIWGYRPGGAFNPDTVRLAPGQFWPMGATGGVVGADVSRLDTGAGRIDVSNLITEELRAQVKDALHDDTLPEGGATPKSATEIMARMRRIAQNYLGAFGRLVNEIIPVIVRRAIEILYDLRLIETDLKIDQLLLRIEVLSPIAHAIRASALNKIVEFMELVIALRGPDALDFIMKVDDAFAEIGDSMGVPAKFLLSSEERTGLEARLTQMATALAEQMVEAQANQNAPGAAAA